MKIGLIDVDGHNWPNLCLMKLSAYHKSRADIVEWHNPQNYYDIVYKSRVFTDTYSKDYNVVIHSDTIVEGGTGYALTGKLPDEIEHIYPDYNLYKQFTQTAYGFLSRGCPRGCGFCIVGEKEGEKSTAVAELSEFWRGQKEIKLLDPNLLACPDWKHSLNQLAESGACVDFTQGLDIRLINEEKIEMLNRVKTKMLHFAWDNPNEDLLPYFEQFSKLTNVKNYRKRCVYVLCNYNSTHEQDLYRVYSLIDKNYDPYIMIYEKPTAPMDTIHLQRWVNNKRIFRTVPNFNEYDRHFNKKKFLIKKSNEIERTKTMSKKDKGKIEKIREDIARTKAKITEFQTRLRELEQLEEETKKNEVYGMVQENDISPDELSEIIRAFCEGKGDQKMKQIEEKEEKNNNSQLDKSVENKDTVNQIH